MSGSEGVVELSLCSTSLPALPSRYGSGADARCGWPDTSRFHTSVPLRGKLHQRLSLRLFSTASFVAAICFVSFAVLSDVLVMRDQREVSLLSHRILSHSVSPPLQRSFRLLPPPVPAAPSAPLTGRFPCWENNGLSTFCIAIVTG